jgi:hypothetical protein
VAHPTAELAELLALAFELRVGFIVGPPQKVKSGSPVPACQGSPSQTQLFTFGQNCPGCRHNNSLRHLCCSSFAPHSPIQKNTPTQPRSPAHDCSHFLPLKLRTVASLLRIAGIMERRTTEGPMDWEYQSKPPMDESSPFTKLAQKSSESTPRADSISPLNPADSFQQCSPTRC